MTVGLLDHLTQAAHIVAGIDCTFEEALEIVKAANEPPAEPIESNIIYGTDFTARRRVDHGLA